MNPPKHVIPFHLKPVMESAIVYNPLTLNELSGPEKNKAIKIYKKNFVETLTPCNTCLTNCCAGCSSSKGYLTSTQFEKLTKKYEFIEIKHFFKNYELRTKGEIDQGFFRKGKGCILPFKERSATCIFFFCSKMDKGQQEAGKKLFSIFWKREY